MLPKKTPDYEVKAKKKIRRLVWGTHLLFFVIIAFANKPNSNKTPKKIQVHVRNMDMPPTQKITAHESKIEKAPISKLEKVENKQPEIPTPVKKKETLTVKKKEQAPSKNKTAKKPVKQEKTKPAFDIPEHLVKELEDSLSKIDAKPKKNSSPKRNMAIPSAPQTLELDRIDDSYLQQEYQMTLVRHLQEKFELPEHGEVKIALTLKKDGSVIKVQVVKAESEKNRVFLEKNLISLVFPSFPFDNEKITFVLTFCNQ